MAEGEKKEVYFGDYCFNCKHYPKGSAEEPCNECLGQPWNYDSHKPINFEKKGG